MDLAAGGPDVLGRLPSLCWEIPSLVLPANRAEPVWCRMLGPKIGRSSCSALSSRSFLVDPVHPFRESTHYSQGFRDCVVESSISWRAGRVDRWSSRVHPLTHVATTQRGSVIPLVLQTTIAGPGRIGSVWYAVLFPLRCRSSRSLIRAMDARAAVGPGQMQADAGLNIVLRYVYIVQLDSRN